MAKKEKVVDLKPTSITTEELKRLQELVSLINKGEMQVGNLEAKKHILLHQVISVQEKMQELQKEFEATYGKVDINITDGTINYPENEQTDKED